MSFQDPFDADKKLASNRGCHCGSHASEAEHQAAVASEEQRFERVVQSAVVRAMFPQDAQRRGENEAESIRRDIAQVRALASQVRNSQPGYAEDLMAAAEALQALRRCAPQASACPAGSAVRPHRAPPQTPLPARAN